MFMAFLCPEISKIKNAKEFLSQKSPKLFAQHNTVWHLFKNFEIKRQKSFFGNILLIIEKIQNFENLSTTHTFYVDLGPKRNLGRRYPVIGSMGYGRVGGGLN